MSEVKTYVFDLKEVTEVLIKHQGLHEGIWQLQIEFGIAGTNLQTGESEVFPAAIVPIKNLGLTKVEKESPIALDAAKVNPSAKAPAWPKPPKK